MKKSRFLISVILFSVACAVCAASTNPIVVLETNVGYIVIQLYPGDAPITVDNFLSYVNRGFYNGLLFHRVENRNPDNGFGLDVIQGGACYYYEGNFYPPPTPTDDPIINESDNGLSNVRGTIAMARTSEPDSATAQFFINHQDNIDLDRDNPDGDGYGYCVFGKVVHGMDVVDSIASAPTVDLQSINPDWPPFTHFPDPFIGMNSVYVLPCDTSYCSDLADKGRISFEDFAIFSLHWLDDCESANGYCDGADLDYSGGVDIVDLELFWDHWAQVTGYERRFSDLTQDDDTINASDLIIMMQRWLDSTCNPNNNYCDRADINRDGIVNMTDYALLSSHWLSSY